MSDFETLPPPVLHSLAAADGWLLRVWDFNPNAAASRPARDAGGPSGHSDLDLRFSPIDRAPVGIVIAGHAMMADSRTICRPDRPTIASVLVAAGFRVLVPDLRGHGDSGPLARDGGDWTMDDLVADVRHYVELARTLEPELPIALLGHSLFSHAALAWLGQNPDADVRALVAMSCSVWNKRFEPSRLYWLIKRLLFWPTVIITRLVGYLPARRLRVGTADEAPSFWSQFHSWIRGDRWGTVDGTIDWWTGLERIRAPLLHVMSEGDRLYARPAAAVRLSAPVPTRELLILGRDDAPGELARMRPDHMGLITHKGSKLAWHWVAGWLRRTLGVAD